MDQLEVETKETGVALTKRMEGGPINNVGGRPLIALCKIGANFRIIIEKSNLLREMPSDRLTVNRQLADGRRIGKGKGKGLALS